MADQPSITSILAALGKISLPEIKGEIFELTFFQQRSVPMRPLRRISSLRTSLLNNSQIPMHKPAATLYPNLQTQAVLISAVSSL